MQIFAVVYIAKKKLGRSICAIIKWIVDEFLAKDRVQVSVNTG